MELQLSAQIEAVLFYKAEPVKIKTLANILDVSEGDITEGISKLESQLTGRGMSLIQKEDSIVIVTTPQMSEIFKVLQKEELSKDLSKSALETLSIILYRGPVTRSEIDYIRGVNSQFILRMLLVRGLIEKTVNPKDERGYLYKTSFDLLSHLGLNKVEDIPEYQKVNEDIESFIATKDNEDNDAEPES